MESRGDNEWLVQMESGGGQQWWKEKIFLRKGLGKADGVPSRGWFGRSWGLPGHRERSAEQEQTGTGMDLPEQLELQQQQQEASEMEIVDKVWDLSRRRIIGSDRRLDEA